MGLLTTEQRNLRSERLDACSAIEIVQLMNSEDAKIAEAVANQSAPIAQSIERIAEAFRRGGRLFYIGAGTSGRLGVLDASECPPTFNSQPEMVVGVIAGGSSALTRAIEGAEDDREQGAADLQQHDFCADDILVGIATSGRTPYVLGALDFARGLGAPTVGITCNENSAMHQHAETMIVPVVGPEILSGSTRLKSGTATKMVLNMLTTGAMVLIGKTFGNLMVDLRATNTKLKERSVRIVSDVTGLDADQAAQLLNVAGQEVKTAIIMNLSQLDADAARARLTSAQGRLREALSDAKGSS